MNPLFEAIDYEGHGQIPGSHESNQFVSLLSSIDLLLVPYILLLWHRFTFVLTDLIHSIFL